MILLEPLLFARIGRGSAQRRQLQLWQGRCSLAVILGHSLWQQQWGCWDQWSTRQAAVAGARHTGILLLLHRARMLLLLLLLLILLLALLRLLLLTAALQLLLRLPRQVL